MSSVVWDTLRASLRLASGLLPSLLPWLPGVQTRRPAAEDGEAEAAQCQQYWLPASRNLCVEPGAQGTESCLTAAGGAPAACAGD